LSGKMLEPPGASERLFTYTSGTPRARMRAVNAGASN